MAQKKKPHKSEAVMDNIRYIHPPSGGKIEQLFQFSFVRNCEFVTAFRPAAR
jgi:hypothetical protein